MLRDGETDIAVILTEGERYRCWKSSKIVQVYVQSPLIWGIHVAANSKYKTVSDLEDTKVAISRQGSGSQLMAYVNADNHGWKTDNLQFEIVNTIETVEALSNGRRLFHVGTFYAKPLVDKGIFRLGLSYSLALFRDCCS
jgi:TRAP-type uncharacterized transport system substrate-binding protein